MIQEPAAEPTPERAVESAPAQVAESAPAQAAEPTPERPGTARLRYRVLTGPDDSTFCQRVSQALADGYQLHGGPALTFDGARVIVAQAVVLPHPLTAQTQEI